MEFVMKLFRKIKEWLKRLWTVSCQKLCFCK